MLFIHMKATGMFNNNIPRDVEICLPYKDAILSIRMAMPVNPPDNKLDGFINTCITYACNNAETVTAVIVIILE